MSVLEDLRYSLAPIMTPALDEYCQALAAKYAQVELYTLDSIGLDGNELPGYGNIFSVDDCPAEALPYLAQFVGETLPSTLTEAEARERIRGQPNRKRGTPAGITAAAALTLTGTKTVFFIERSSSACPSEPAYGLTVGTLASETPDADATEAAIRSNIPGGIILEFITSDDPVWSEAVPTWTSIGAAVTWAGVTFADVT